MADFITKQSINFFTCLGIDTSFLKVPPRIWSQNEAFKKGLSICKHLKVTNDHAERGVALISIFCDITPDEKQLQFALQVVEHQRKGLPSITKSSVVKYLKRDKQ